MMKKLMVASAIAMTMTAGSAMAATQTIQFTGAVTSKTCDLVVDGNNSGQINLGATDGINSGTNTGPEVAFVLKPGAEAGDCDSITKAQAAWNSSSLNYNGIGNDGGGAKGSYVLLTAESGTDVTTDDTDAIKSGANVVTYRIANSGLRNEGLKYKAKLVSGGTAGDYRAVVTYAVSYD